MQMQLNVKQKTKNKLKSNLIQIKTEYILKRECKTKLVAALGHTKIY